MNHVLNSSAAFLKCSKIEVQLLILPSAILLVHGDLQSRIFEKLDRGVGDNSARTDTSDWLNAHEYYETKSEVAQFQVRFEQTIKFLNDVHEFLLLIALSTTVAQHTISFLTLQCRRQHGSSRDWQR